MAQQRTPAGKAAAPARADAGDREARVREIAYALYERRGGSPDHALDDWLQAEAQVDGRPDAPAGAPVDTSGGSPPDPPAGVPPKPRRRTSGG